MIALAGNKSDLSAKRMVDHDEAYAYADENGLLFMETSAKTAMNVTDIFLAIGKRSSYLDERKIFNENSLYFGNKCSCIYTNFLTDVQLRSSRRASKPLVLGKPKEEE